MRGEAATLRPPVLRSRPVAALLAAARERI
jgi:hypothetical protein